MDSGDKATNKALSIAYKYMAFQLFAIPIDEDPDRHTHEVGKSPGKTLAPSDIDIIRKLLVETDVTEEKLHEIYKVTGLEQIPMSKMAEITSNLQKRIKQKEEA